MLSWRRAVLGLAAGSLLLAPTLTTSAAAASTCGPWMNTHQTPSQRAKELVAAMTTDQKVQELHQYLAEGPFYGTAGYIPAIPSLCVPVITLNDAGSGLGDFQTDVTSYPAGISQASTFDRSMVNQVGSSLGAEAHAKGIDVLLAPNVNLVRTPLGGRTSEMYGEDPYLSGQLGVSYIKGVQGQHVVASVKQYDANNQEADRYTVDARVDPRTLAEIYQAPFADAVEQGHAGSVMCAYNKINTLYSCENPTELRTDLDDRYGFKGFVLSDWGATHSTIASVRAGLDMEMDSQQSPFGSQVAVAGNVLAEGYYSAPLLAAIKAGTVTSAQLDEMVERVFYAFFSVGSLDDPPAAEPAAYTAVVDTPAAQQVALKSAEEGSVLLKNTGVLPLQGKGKTIALIGLDASADAEFADQGGGSVQVNQPVISTPLDAITTRAAKDGDTVVYDPGASPTTAAAVASHTDVAIVYAGYKETENADLKDFTYTAGGCEHGYCLNTPSGADAVIAAVAKANPKTVVVLNTGGPALMPWLAQVQGVLEAWYPGEQDGAAAADLLFGDVNPSGKLPVTFPASLAQGPLKTASQYPGVGLEESYSEKLLVGYRWYDAKHLTPLFPFGFGLSYTSFAFSDLHLVSRGSGADVVYTVTNTGTRSGAEVGQVYVTDPASVGEPPQQLKGFQRTTLAPGRSARVTIPLDAKAFSYFSVAKGTWVVAPGCYTVKVGDSSTAQPLAATLPRGDATCAKSVARPPAALPPTTSHHLPTTGLDPELGLLALALLVTSVAVRRR